ncbi:peptide transporter Ptr2p [[Candida] jaroonii]|uniref:Peptide transporter Ptr2p n=1 Tax=[Candida] jaroonii TaxID=467808 RepID=A0ACA9Y5Y0_9ASCO|nr:peptide transporter Ptr2p [[Candida] jaroonii]
MSEKIDEKVSLPVEKDTKAVNEESWSDAISEEYDFDDERNYNTLYTDEYNPRGLRFPTKQESQSLRRILGRAPYQAYLICLVELAERASYYSTTGLLSNFIQRPLPEGSTTGAPQRGKAHENESAGALDMGLQAATALTLLLTFLAYLIPLYGGYVADTSIGRLKAIWIGVAAGFISHVLFIIAGIPSVIAGGHAIAPTILAILSLCVGTGFIKPNLLPLLMDQYRYETDVVKVLPSGEKVIVDKEKTLERMTLVFYWAINIGAFFQLATSYCARDVGYWLGFFIPIVMYLFLPIVLFIVGPKLYVSEIQGSVMKNFIKILRVSFEGGWISRYRAGEFWEWAKPTNMAARGRDFFTKSKPISWNDQWVLDVAQTVNACKIFFYFPIYLMNDGGIGTVQTSQAGSMSLNGVPNDLFNNFNPLAIIIFIPILDYIIYPFLRKNKIEFRPVWRITLGFVIAAVSQAVGAIIQHFIYQKSPCGDQASTCDDVAPISAWVEVILYIMQAISECFANTTSYELAYTRAPPHLKSLVMAICLFMSALSAALSQAVTPALVDPNITWAFVAMAVIGMIFAVAFFFHFRNLHVEMEQERIEREAADRRLQAELIAHGGIEDDRNLQAVTSIKSAVGK